MNYRWAEFVSQAADEFLQLFQHGSILRLSLFVDEWLSKEPEAAGVVKDTALFCVDVADMVRVESTLRNKIERLTRSQAEQLEAECREDKREKEARVPAWKPAYWQRSYQTSMITPPRHHGEASGEPGPADVNPEVAPADDPDVKR